MDADKKTDREILAALVASLYGAEIHFNGQFAIGLQVKGAARVAKKNRLTREFREALAQAKTQVGEPQEDRMCASCGDVNTVKIGD